MGETAVPGYNIDIMQANYVQRLRLTFSKTGPTRYIGHLDLALTLERALNRARIPIAYTQGYNKRPRMQMASALPLGFTSEYELADIWLEEKMDPDQARRQMMTKMAPGIEVYRVEEVDLREDALQTQTAASHYTAVPLDPIDKAELQTRIDELLAADRHVRRRFRGKKKKEYDLRPLIFDLTLDETDEGAPQIHMRLSLGQGGTGRPDEVLHSLGLDPLAARICRTRIVLQDEMGSRI